jgi:hypothetical protein
MPEPEIDWADLGATYGWSVAFMNSHPDLKRIVVGAVREGWDGPTILAKVRGTHWYRAHSEAWRKAAVLESTDPAEFKSQVTAMQRHVANVYAATVGHTANAGWAKNVAQQAVRLGWTDEQLQQVVHQGSRIYNMLHSDQLGGEAGDLEDKMRQYARDQGVEVSDMWLSKQIASAVRGGFGEGNIQNAILRMAKAKYSAFADDLEGGATMRDIAEPYIQMMSKELEIAPGQLDVNHQKIQQALARRETNKEGKSHGNPMALWEFQKVLRNDPRWAKTNGAQEQLMGVGHDVLKNMGLVT